LDDGVAAAIETKEGDKPDEEKTKTKKKAKKKEKRHLQEAQT
jgi:hypothetical protein